ncbi:Threonine dehydratase biosynthetic, chloroplastic [Capsicum annuum]|uniref:Threonine dehydratase n=1 Tax=Capsicum annuum TaxID=4072 RepID=A0A2G2YPX9_CAPAN|nr:Threonine dehydratase biosynthetic, chloroplastic [Capsicum annuum]PHT71725.1 Threonine dehydratase biosynthetic, chloroplastic [Capsicum annuum]
MEFLCLAPTHNFPNNSKFPTICPSGHNTKTSCSRVRPLAVPLKISQLISSFNPFEPEVSSLRSLENIEPGELIVNNPTGGDKDDIQYFLDMLSSPVYDVAVESPLQQSMNISERLGVNFYMKREDRQSMFSFKIRGAYNMMSKLPDDQLSKGVITASAGNHAMGVALSAQKLKSSATIVMPVTTPEFKREAVENTGATVILRGNTFDEAHEYAMTMSQDEDLTFIPPYDHPDIIKGQGTIGAEISRQFSKSVHAIFVPIGGGGLAAGIATYMKQVSPSTKIIGVEPYGACSMALSLSNGVRVKLENVDNFADGVAVGLVGEEPFRICKNLIDGMVLVDRDAISATIKDVYDEEKNILETSGALAIAGAEAYCKYYNIKNENIVAIASGANMDFSKFKSIMDLANIGAKKEALLATFMPEEPGSFKRFTQLVSYFTHLISVLFRFVKNIFFRTLLFVF